MKVICPNCKSENLMGAVFCRSCGHKIVVEEMAAGDIQLTQEKTNWARVRYWVGETVIFLVTLTLVILALTTENLRPLPPEVQKYAGDWGKYLKDSCGKGAVHNGLKQDQLNAALVALLGLNQKDAIEIPNSGMWLTGAAVYLDKDRVRGVFRVKSFGVSYDFTVKLLVFQQPGKPPTILVDSARMGKLPMPGPLRKVVQQRAESILGLDQTGTLTYLSQPYAYRQCVVAKNSVSAALVPKPRD